MLIFLLKHVFTVSLINLLELTDKEDWIHSMHILRIFVFIL